MPFKVAIYCLTKNEEAFVDRMIGSCLEADEIVICDTGSTDATWAKLQAWAGQRPGQIKIHQISVAPWRFDIPRNVSLGLVSADVDICICLDLDEVMQPGWRPALEADWTEATTRLRYPYVWSWTADGAPEVAYHADKIHARHHYRWHHPVHEVLKPYLTSEVQTWSEGVRIHHHPDDAKSRAQYLPLLELAVQEDPHDDRNAFYLGREYFYRCEYDKAVVELARHRALPRAQWNAERAASYRFTGKSFLAQGRFDEAAGMFAAAAAEAPEMREPWLDLAYVYYLCEAWPLCYQACRTALAITDAPMAYLVEHAAYRGPLVHDLLSIAAWRLGHGAEALDHARRALALEPDNARFQANVQWLATA